MDLKNGRSNIVIARLNLSLLALNEGEPSSSIWLGLELVVAVTVTSTLHLMIPQGNGIIFKTTINVHFYQG